MKKVRWGRKTQGCTRGVAAGASSRAHGVEIRGRINRETRLLTLIFIQRGNPLHFHRGAEKRGTRLASAELNAERERENNALFIREAGDGAVGFVRGRCAAQRKIPVNSL